MRDAARLELVEEGAYRRLIDAYYVAEGPLPADRRECYKLAGAVKPAERKAVDYVLGKFFDETPDGFRHKRCDLEIAKYLEGEPDRAAKRENEKLRQKRARERRKVLFDQLREFGIVPSFDATTAQLEAELSRVTTDTTSRTRHAPVTRDNTATQTPDTRHQSPVLKTSQGETPSIHSPRDGVSPSPGEVCKAMRDAGISRVNPSNPILHRLIAEGATLSEFVDAVPGSLSDHVKSPFSHALGTVEGRRKEAAIRASTGGTLRDRERADTTHTLAGGLISDQATKLRKDATHGRTIDGEAKRVD